jgi:hypothetical protein
VCIKLSFWFFYVPLALGGFAWFLSGNDATKNLPGVQSMRGTGVTVVDQFPLLLAQSGSLAVIIILCVWVGSSGWVFWTLLVIVMAELTFIPYKKGFHPFMGDIYLLGMIAHAWPMKGREIIVKHIRAYWPPMVVLLMILMIPHVKGRCDLNPLNTWWERMRFRSLEAALLVFFLSGAMNPWDPLGIIPWMNLWALYAYCVHVFWARLLPVPLGAVVTYLGAVPFLILAYRDWRKRKLNGDNGELLIHESKEEAERQCERPHRS